MKWYRSEKKEVLKELGSSITGLTNEEANRRLKEYGYNELKKKEQISALKIFLLQFKSFIIYIMLAALLISLLTKEVTDAIVIAAIIILNAVLGFIQEFKAERSIEALKKLAVPNALVIRDGKEKYISSRELVPGDVIILESGNKVPADCYLLESFDLKVDESTLTGESVSVDKKVGKIDLVIPVAEQKNMVFSSTSVSYGRAKAIVVETGMKTEIGKIAELIQKAEIKMTPLQKKLEHFGVRLGVAVLIIAVIVFLSGILRGGSISQMLLVSVSLAVAAIPEGLPAVVTISLALGLQRMIKKNVLIRKLSAVETLGNTTVICADKTGTLTCNQMTVKKIYANDKYVDVTGSGYSDRGDFLVDNKKINVKYIEKLLETGLLCNNTKLVDGEVIGDPTEAALLIVAEKAGIKSNYEKIDEIPFSSEKKYMGTINKIKDKNILHLKGAPEVIVNKCKYMFRDGRFKLMTKNDKRKILEKNEEMANSALRVLAFAYSRDNTEKELIFLGLMGMIDPPRKEVKESIELCRKAGIRTVMITGDHKLTALAIGKHIGLGGDVVTGEELDRMDDNKLKDMARKVEIYARVSPQHKVRILKALQDSGNIVAMTGDGVNDAPALKKADIGISVNNGTDVAKEASEMVLLDNNFVSIVRAVEEGRGIYDNIKKFINYLLSSNLGEVLVVFLAMLIGFMYNFVVALPLIAVQLLWINIVTDGLPALALGVDSAAPGIMDRKPRKKNESIITKNMGLNIIVMGILMSVAALILFSIGLKESLIKAELMVFTALVVFEIFRVYMVRASYKLNLFSNKYLIGAVVLSLLLQMLVIYTPLATAFTIDCKDVVKECRGMGNIECVNFVQDNYDNVLPECKSVDKREVVPLLNFRDWFYIIIGSVVILAVGIFSNKLIRKYTKEMD